MKKQAIVLGCGMVGATIARDLAAQDAFSVTAVDVSQANLDRLADIAETGGLSTKRADLGTPSAVRKVIAEADVVLGAMPSKLGLMILQTVIEAGKPYADISFMAEDARQFDELARQKGVTAVVDCGVAPGLANIIIGHCHANLERTDRVAFYVGGLPKEPSWPYLYKAPFAPADVIEEYTRPARLKENGEIVVRPALSDPERIKFDVPFDDGVQPVTQASGTGDAIELEAFNTDGLRSLLDTIDCPTMVEKTLRWPGHAELMAILRETGYFSKDEIDLGGVSVRPLDVTARLLFPMWTYKPGEEEFTILRVIVEGAAAGAAGDTVRHTYDLYDAYDARTGQTSMARTTGFPCAIVARMLADGEIHEQGVLPPEHLGRIPGMLARITTELARRGVHLHSREEML